jgi:putative ATP-dependent endonuclease of OLD family
LRHHLNRREGMGDLLFRWQQGSTEEAVINLVPEDQFERLIEDPKGEKTGTRLRSLQERLNATDKDFATIKATAGDRLRTVIIEAALGKVPEGTEERDKKHFKSQASSWFKSLEGGEELGAKVFALGLWPRLKDRILPFCNAVRKALKLPPLEDLPS